MSTESFFPYFAIAEKIGPRVHIAAGLMISWECCLKVETVSRNEHQRTENEWELTILLELLSQQNWKLETVVILAVIGVNNIPYCLRQDEFSFCFASDNVWSNKVIKQHLFIFVSFSTHRYRNSLIHWHWLWKTHVTITLRFKCQWN